MGGLVRGDETGAQRLGIVGRGEFTPVQDADGALRAHDGDTGGGPGEVEVGAQVFGAHHRVAAPYALRTTTVIFGTVASAYAYSSLAPRRMMPACSWLTPER